MSNNVIPLSENEKEIFSPNDQNTQLCPKEKFAEGMVDYVDFCLPERSTEMNQVIEVPEDQVKIISTDDQDAQLCDQEEDVDWGVIFFRHNQKKEEKKKKRKEKKRQKKAEKKKKKKQEKKARRKWEKAEREKQKNALSTASQKVDVLSKWMSDRVRRAEEQLLWDGRMAPWEMKLSLGTGSGVFFGVEKGASYSSTSYVGKSARHDGHIAVFGGSGSGKSTGIAMPTFSTWKGTIFTFDFKGELLERARNQQREMKILFLCDDIDGEYYYDPFCRLRDGGEERLVQNARELAYAIIPLSDGSQEPFWPKSARNVLTGVLVYYFHLGVGFIEAMILTATTPLKELLEKIRTDRRAAACVTPDLAESSKLLVSVSAELNTHISIFASDPVVQNALSPVGDDSKLPIYWEDLEKRDILVRIDQSQIEEWGSVIRLLLVQLTSTLRRRPEKYSSESADIKPTLLLLDEFPQYGKVEEITSSMKILRSKKVSITLFCQSLADLDQTYGKDTRRTIMDNCPYKVILNACDAETQQYFSDLTGTIPTIQSSIAASLDEEGSATSYNTNIHDAREPLLYPHEFATLSDVIVLHPQGRGFCRLKKVCCSTHDTADCARIKG